MEKKSISLFRRRLTKFRSLKRGYYSFLILTCATFLSIFNPLLINNRALVVSHNGSMYFPAIAGHYEAQDFGQRRIGEANYRQLQTDFSEAGEGNWVLMPPYPFHPNENLLRELEGSPPHSPSVSHWMGTDDRGRDVFARLVYGFRISMFFGLGVVLLSYSLGITGGAILGFFGGRIDIFGQRLVEIWAAMPFLYTVIIISSIIKPSLLLLIPLLAIFRWMGTSFLMRGEFYREKSRDYVAAAIAQGDSRTSIMFRHLLPNSLTPIVSYMPFAFVAAIFSLVSLDFLGFGLQPPTPSWGEIIKQAHANGFSDWHLVIFPLIIIFCTLIMAVFIGEAAREAFDPKRFSRLR
jgi:microcin C transport system permease protein